MNSTPHGDTCRKLRVLFVESEPSILAILPRLLAGMKNAWDMTFVGNTREGINQINLSPFDVVISGLPVTGNDGNSFFEEVRDLSPLAMRIACSSYSDKQSILDCGKLVHQFLPKPFDRDILISTIERVAILSSLLADSEMRRRISQLETIPSIPRLYQELIRHLQSSDNTIEDIAGTVSQDIGMTLQILKLANSAYFGLPEPTSNVAKAIGHLGVETVKYMALAIGVFSQFESRKLGGISIDVIWHHSVKTSAAARHIAKLETKDRQIIEDAAAAGLLHDLGKLILASSYPDKYESVGQIAHLRHVEWLIEERRAFGFDHAEVGRYLLALWGLPYSIIEAVGFHHYPTKTGQSHFSALTAVHAANVLVQTLRPTHGGIAPPQIDHLYIAHACRPNAVPRWREELAEPPSI